MSRGHDARRKAKRRQVRAAVAKPARRWRPTPSRRLLALIPALVIAGILAATAVVGFGAGNATTQEQVKQEVNALLAGVPQNGSTLGSPGASITLMVYADMECPTVRLFVEDYLPSMVDRWVRTGIVKIEYGSLQTDTVNERTFFRQEIAALAAGRQDKMWNFLLTFVREQGDHFTDYATDEFLTDIASQVSELKEAQWRSDRADGFLSRQVAHDVYSAHRSDFQYTPSFALKFTNSDSRVDPATASMEGEFRSSLLSDVESLRKESSGDVPTLKTQS